MDLHNTQSGEWKEIRLFISSTFRDMQAERDYLVRFIFPRIREELLIHHIHFIDVDLRWGITDESNITGACLSIIDECHPLFLGILGGRYGWIPGNTEDAISVTEEEIRHAIKNNGENDYKQLLFLFRSEQDTLAIKEAYPGEYRESEGSSAAKKLELLKKKIRGSGFPVSEYNAKWDESSNKLVSLFDFGEMVYEYIHCYAVQHLELQDETSQEPSLADDLALDLYISERNRFYIATGLEEPLEILQKATKRREENSVILVTGQGGIGKSAFLCHYIEQCRREEKVIILPHFVGVTPNSSELSGMLTTLCRQMDRYISSAEPIPFEIDRLILHFLKGLQNLDKNKKYILIIDGVNQMLPDQGALELHWLPLYFPTNLMLILSTAAEDTAGTIRSRWPGLTEINLHGLNGEASREMVDFYLDRYQKKLTARQIELVLSKEYAHVPLYLSTIIEELRIYGSYDTLTDFVSTLPQDTLSLLKWIIKNRIAGSPEFVNEQGELIGSDLVRRYFSFLYISSAGLSEKELTEILSCYNIHGNIAVLTRQLRPFLTLHGELLNYFHDDIRKAVYSLYIRNVDLTEYHHILAAYFYSKTDPKADGSFTGRSMRDYCQLIYHRIQTGNRRAMAELIQHGFLEAYRALEMPARFLKNARELLYFLSTDEDSGEKDEEAIWRAGLRILRNYVASASLISGAGATAPHELERAIAEGRDEDAACLIESADDSQKVYLRTAAAVLYRAARRERAADKIAASGENEQQPSVFGISPVLYDALGKATSPEVTTARQEEYEEDKEEEKSAGIPATPQKEPVTLKNLSVKPRRSIPLPQLFVLDAIGRKDNWYSFYFLIAGAVAILAFTPLYSAYDSILTWCKGKFFEDIIEVPGTLAFAAILLGVPFFIFYEINKLLRIVMTRLQSCQIQAMIMNYKKSPVKKKTQALMSCIHYCRLLGEAHISASSDNQLFREALTEHAHFLIGRLQFGDAADLLAYYANVGDYSVLFEALRDLPPDILQDLLLRILRRIKRISAKSRPGILKPVLKLYLNKPPIPVLLSVLPMVDDVDKPLLASVDKTILAACLIRSCCLMHGINDGKRSRLTIQFYKLRSAISSIIPQKIKDFFERKKIVVLTTKTFHIEPHTAAWHEVLIQLPSAIMIAVTSIPVFWVLLAMSFGDLISLFVLIAAMTALYRLTRKWREYMDISHDDTDLLEDCSIDASTAVQTALAKQLEKHPNDGVVILEGLSIPDKANVWLAVIRQTPCRPSLLRHLLNFSQTLPDILPAIEKDASAPVRSKQISWEKQWDLVHPFGSIPVTTVLMAVLSVALCAAMEGILYLLPVPWLRLLLKEQWWMLLICPAAAALLSVPYVRRTVFLLPIAIICAYEELLERSILTGIVFGDYLYMLLPTLAILLAYQLITRFRGGKLLFPTRHELIVTKLKSGGLVACGCVVTAGVLYVMLFLNTCFAELNLSPSRSAVVTLQNYAIMHMQQLRPGDLHSNSLVDRVSAWADRETVYQYNLLKRVNNCNAISLTYGALAKFGYPTNDYFVMDKMMQNVGYAYYQIVEINNTRKEILLDAQDRQVQFGYVITHVTPYSKAEKLGLKKGDVILSFDGYKFTVTDILYQIWSSGKTAPLTISVSRDGKIKNYTITPSSLEGLSWWYINLDCLS